MLHILKAISLYFLFIRTKQSSHFIQKTNQKYFQT